MAVLIHGPAVTPVWGHDRCRNPCGPGGAFTCMTRGRRVSYIGDHGNWGRSSAPILAIPAIGAFQVYRGPVRRRATPPWAGPHASGRVVAAPGASGRRTADLMVISASASASGPARPPVERCSAPCLTLRRERSARCVAGGQGPYERAKRASPLAVLGTPRAAWAKGRALRGRLCRLRTAQRLRTQSRSDEST